MPMSIYVVGAQCTGKTTLVEALKAYFIAEKALVSLGRAIPPPSVLTEVARTVLRQHNFTADDIVSSPKKALRLQELILKAQEQTEQAAEDGWVISDRSGVDPIVYTRRYVGEAAAQSLIESAPWAYLKERMKRSLIIVCEAGADWLNDDGIRLMPEDRRDWMGLHDLFCATLDSLGLTYHTIPYGLQDLDRRVNLVVQNWKKRSESMPV